MKIWTLTVASPRGIQAAARRIEAAGYDGLYVVDSQNLSGDCYVALAMAAVVTEKIGLGTGVTNSVTRVAAATACGIGSVQRISGGRAVLGIGRGDSALAHLGRAPARLRQFERYLDALSHYLRGAEVQFANVDIDVASAPPVADLKLADTPHTSRIAWLAEGPAVPIEVAASGPRVIAMAARTADRVMLTVGASPERLQWGIALAKEAAQAAGRDPDALKVGAYVNLATHADRAIARSLVRGGLTTFARFSVMHGKAAGPLTADQRKVLNDLHGAYDMRSHTRGDSPQASELTDAFIDEFAIVGKPQECVARLAELQKLGLDKVAVSGAGGADGTPGGIARALFEHEVLPAARG